MTVTTTPTPQQLKRSARRREVQAMGQQDAAWTVASEAVWRMRVSLSESQRNEVVRFLYGKLMEEWPSTTLASWQAEVLR